MRAIIAALSEQEAQTKGFAAAKREHDAAVAASAAQEAARMAAMGRAAGMEALRRANEEAATAAAEGEARLRKRERRRAQRRRHGRVRAREEGIRWFESNGYSRQGAELAAGRSIMYPSRQMPLRYAPPPPTEQIEYYKGVH